MPLSRGEMAPDFKLSCATGEVQGEFTLSNHRGKKIVILFYALDFTPACKDELRAAQANLAQFVGHNAEVIGVNTDAVPSHIAYQKQLGGLSYPLASDRWPYAEVAKSYGIFPPARHPVPYLNDRAAFIVDEAGKIAWSKTYELGETPEMAEILEALRQLEQEEQKAVE